MPTSSNNPCVCDTFSPDSEYRVLPSLTVVTKTGAEIPIPVGAIKLAAGANMAITVLEDEDVATIAAAPGFGVENPYYRQKYDALAGLSQANTPAAPAQGPIPDPASGFTPSGDPWSFTYQSMWIAKMTGIGADPISGAFFMTGDECFGVGEFEADNPGYPQGAREDANSSSCGAELAVLDICTPCMDCGLYQQLGEYLDRLRVFYDYLSNITNDDTPSIPPEHPDGGLRESRYGLYQQYMAGARYWDYLLHMSTIKLSAQGQGQSIVAAGFYRNISPSDIGAGPGVGVQTDISFQFFRGACPWEGISSSIVEIRALDRSGKNSAYLAGVVYTDGSLPGGCPSGPGAHTVTASLQSGSDLGPNGEVYADVALLLTNTQLFEEPGEDFTVVVRLCVQQTHLTPAIQCRAITVHFRPANAPETSNIPRGSLP